jgi:hypothetical protein
LEGVAPRSLSRSPLHLKIEREPKADDKLHHQRNDEMNRREEQADNRPTRERHGKSLGKPAEIIVDVM